MAVLLPQNQLLSYQNPIQISWGLERSSGPAKTYIVNDDRLIRQAESVMSSRCTWGTTNSHIVKFRHSF